MNGKKWIKVFSIFFFSCTLLLSATNYTIDPFNIFHTKILKHQFQMNERFMKIEYLEKHNKEFNGYMFGSSRIGTTPPSVIEKYIPNSKIYNFSISGANLYDYITHLRYFIEHKYPIETIYLQLDIDNMNSFGRSSSDYLRKLHPYTLNQSLNLYYMSYLNGLFPLNIKGKILKNINYTDRTDYFLDIGISTKPDKEKAIKDDYKKFQQGVSSFNKKVSRTVKYGRANQNLEALKNIKKLCENNNIKLYLFTTPHNKNMMDMFKIDEYLRYLEDLSSIVDFYDFSGYNTITMDNYNYYEWSHYRPLVGTVIAGRIFNDPSIKVPDDFGVFITQDNIEKHLKNLRKQIKNYDLKKQNL
ncbi:MAG: hypothetical protein JJV94_06330 [Sulfurospirillum sp.]|nr:hypothetical protein [Sulfurospirillum sp.]